MAWCLDLKMIILRMLSFLIIYIICYIRLSRRRSRRRISVAWLKHLNRVEACSLIAIMALGVLRLLTRLMLLAVDHLDTWCIIIIVCDIIWRRLLSAITSTVHTCSTAFLHKWLAYTGFPRTHLNISCVHQRSCFQVLVLLDALLQGLIVRVPLFIGELLLMGPATRGRRALLGVGYTFMAVARYRDACVLLVMWGHFL